MKTPVTKLDLYQSAHEAATQSLTLTTALLVDAARVDDFKAAGHDPLDYDVWSAYFTNIRATMTGLAVQDAPSSPAATI